MSKLIFSNISDIESIISILATMLSGLFFLSKYFEGRRYKTKFTNLDSRTKQAIKCYIPTKAQLTDPCDQDNDKNCSSFELLPFFLADFKNSDTQYFMVLADSGMGKTTFLLKLYFAYKKKVFKKYRIIFFPLSQPDVIIEIKKMKHKPRTILLLDCLDEDQFAMNDYQKRLQELCNATESFYKIIITCRTQFFPNSDSEPQETGRIRVGVGDKNIEFIKYYISPFSYEDINLYLDKRYSNIFKRKNIEKITQSKELIDNCPQLMYRPMLLSYADDLILNSGKKYVYVYEIYHDLVFKWINRELVKNKLLYEFSEKVAEYMYVNKTTNIVSTEIEKLCKRYNINLRIIEAKSRSLLNRNANGNYKFAHKSILEFFLFEKALKEVEFRKRIILNGFNGYEMLELFIKEKSSDYLTEFLQNNSMELKPKKFQYLLLFEADLSGIKIANCDFEECTFVKTNFTISYLENVNFVKSNLEEAIFLGAVLRNTKFEYANLKKCEFRNAYFENTDLEGANLEGARLEGASLKGINLREANLRMTSLSWACLTGADLTGADLYHAVLINCDFRKSILRGINVNKAYLVNSKSKFLFEYNNDVLDLGNDFKRSLEGADLTGVDLSGVNLSNMNFQSAKLVSTNLSNSILINSNFSNTDLKGTELEASVWDRENVLLVKSELKNARFRYIFMEDKKKIYRSQLFHDKDILNHSKDNFDHEEMERIKKAGIDLLAFWRTDKCGKIEALEEAGLDPLDFDMF